MKDTSHQGPDHAFVSALLTEIAAQLAACAETVAETSIDLRSLPMMPATRAELDRRMGVGEVRATIAGSGRTEIVETAYTGVWRLAHYDAHDTLLMEEIAIARVPAILGADPSDISHAAARLAAAPNTPKDGEADV